LGAVKYRLRRHGFRIHRVPANSQRQHIMNQLMSLSGACLGKATRFADQAFRCCCCCAAAAAAKSQ
jgi:hypothetical protein